MKFEKPIILLSTIVGLLVGMIAIWQFFKPGPEVVVYVQTIDAPLPARLKKAIEELGTWDVKKLREAVALKELNKYTDEEIENHLVFYKELIEHTKNSLDPTFLSIDPTHTQITIQNNSKEKLTNVILRNRFIHKAFAQIYREGKDEVMEDFNKRLLIKEIEPLETIKIHIYQDIGSGIDGMTSLLYNNSEATVLYATYVDRETSLRGGLYISYRSLVLCLVVVIVALLALVLYLIKNRKVAST